MPMVIEDKKVSVIIPVYNVSGYLDKCIKSVVDQTYKNLEIILVDDGSTDNSPEICDGYAERDDRIKVVHKKNGGLSSARNAGLDVAKGDYVSFIDGDDSLEKDAVAVMLNEAVKQSSQIVMMKMRNVSEGEILKPTEQSGSVLSKRIENRAFIKDICTYKSSCSCCDKLFDRKIFDAYRFREGRNNEDLLLLGMILLENDYDIYCVDYTGYNYLRRDQSITHSGFGKSITDAVYNCADLIDVAKRYKPDVIQYVQMLLLYQIRTFLIFMPKRYIRERHRDYVFALNLLKKNKRMIWKSFFSFKDKIFLKTFLMNKRLTKIFVGEK